MNHGQLILFIYIDNKVIVITTVTIELVSGLFIFCHIFI
ncbi:Hypothetical protein EAG7_04248 [Klebsiella aerogenes]|nr:Hypothetical protein EAG7_04248 [Klebsiella aerogenes]PVF77270.1 putative membrane protein [Klebsiella aerogenes]CCG32743.1 hypothetical protein [Klebsiella aerogenes EA1509E]